MIIPLAVTSPVMAYFTAIHRTETLRHWTGRRGMVLLDTASFMSRLSVFNPLTCQALFLVKTIGFIHQEATDLLGLECEKIKM